MPAGPLIGQMQDKSHHSYDTVELSIYHNKSFRFVNHIKTWRSDYYLGWHQSQNTDVYLL